MSTDNGNGRTDGAPKRATGRAPGNGNLRPPWPKGVSGNPKGAKPGLRPLQSFTELVRIRMAEQVPGDPECRTRLQRLADALESQALEGSTKAAELFLERIDPAPRQAITINNNVQSPILIALRRIGIESLENQPFDALSENGARGSLP